MGEKEGAVCPRWTCVPLFSSSSAAVSCPTRGSSRFSHKSSTRRIASGAPPPCSDAVRSDVSSSRSGAERQTGWREQSKDDARMSEREKGRVRETETGVRLGCHVVQRTPASLSGYARVCMRGRVNETIAATRCNRIVADLSFRLSRRRRRRRRCVPVRGRAFGIGESSARANTRT